MNPTQASTPSVSVSVGAVIRRINRRLPEGEILRTSRSARQALDLGWYWVHDTRRNLSLETHVALEAFAREVGALMDHETLVD